MNLLWKLSSISCVGAYIELNIENAINFELHSTDSAPPLFYLKWNKGGKLDPVSRTIITQADIF